MSFLDKAKDLLNQHDDKVDQALEKAGEIAKGRFAGHDSQIDGAIDRAQAMTGTGDTTQVPAPVDSQPADEQQLEPTPAEQLHDDQPRR